MEIVGGDKGGGAHCSDDAASFDGDGRSDSDKGDDVIDAQSRRPGN